MRPQTVLILALPETAGSALYGMIDVLSAAGNLWETLVARGEERSLFRPVIVSPAKAPFRCGNGIPVFPEAEIAEDPEANIIILPEIWLRPEESLRGRHSAVTEWLLRSYQRGACLYSACSGAIMLAETGLLDGREATSHWGYAELFRKEYPRVRFNPAPNLVIADREGRIVTAGGTTSWHDLVLHIIARHCGAAEALRISQVYLLKWHDEGQLPYVFLPAKPHHADAAVKTCEAYLDRHFLEEDVLEKSLLSSALPPRTLKRRFKAATGVSMIEYVQRLRIEGAKRLLEASDLPVDEVAARSGYAEPAFFRRLFKRMVGLTPGAYRRLFSPGGSGAGDLGTRAA
jgi:transcriptional regulator GlxA family with amidase domain